jgi:hypothetical protein
MPKCAKKEFPLKIAKEVLYFDCEWHLIRAYTFAAAASRLLRYKKLKF